MLSIFQKRKLRLNEGLYVQNGVGLELHLSFRCYLPRYLFVSQGQDRSATLGRMAGLELG